MNIDISEYRKEMSDMARKLVSIVKEKMIEYYAGDSRRVHHFLKVHSFAKLIAEIENMDPGEQEVLDRGTHPRYRHKECRTEIWI